MKNSRLAKSARSRFGAVVLVLTFTPQFSICFGQGSLTPPGTPGPTMKSLDQIEARTPISSAPFTINAPGSYYLTKNLSVATGNAITITANNVTLDLNGFTISSTQNPANGTGILLGSAEANVTIFNGTISGSVTFNGSNYVGSGFGDGISYVALTGPLNVRVFRVTVSGCLNDGINLGNGGFGSNPAVGGTLVESCTVSTVGNTGISAHTVSNSNAIVCGIIGVFGDSVQNCFAFATGNGIAISAQTASNCYGQASGGAGISSYTAENCSGTSSTANGIDTAVAINCVGGSSSGHGVNAQNSAVSCWGTSNGGRGVNTAIAQNCYGATASGVGLYATFAATNCYGTASSTGGGIQAGTAENCYGTGNGGGIYCTSASNCYGTSGGSGNGVNASQSAVGCYGSSSSGFGLNCVIAAFSRGVSSSSTGIFAGNYAFCCVGSSISGHQYFCGSGASPYP